ncbi:MAG: hypothetical protein WAU69_08385 [Solirubrobacteraceae bacterium]
MSLLGERLLEIHDALSAAGLPHAFGGAIALAYCTQEPRGTRDLDVNIFVSPAAAGAALAALPAGVAVSPADVERAMRDGQVRLWWEETPIDIFLDVHDFHVEVAAGVRERPFMDRAIPVVDCTALAVFKALFDRTRDWADMEEMIAAGSLDVSRATLWLRHFQGQESSAATRLEALCAGAAGREDLLE